MSEAVRPTKKQRELLDFIEQFINENGYSPSYREIMHGLQYTSVATVALHVGNLIKRGHLRKRDHSARSLEVVKHQSYSSNSATMSTLGDTEDKHHVAWLAGLIEAYVHGLEAEDAQSVRPASVPSPDDVHTVLTALELLGFSRQAQTLRQELVS